MIEKMLRIVKKITEAEVDKFKEFMNEYADILGVAKSVVAELINDKFVRKLLQQVKKYNWEQLCPNPYMDL